MNQLQWKRRSVVGGLLIASGLGAGVAGAYTAPYATPPGVTLIDVSKLMDEGSPQYLWRRLGDNSGNPLYTYDADTGGKSSCYDDCAKEFTPYVADAHAKGFGDWAILERDDHVKQWSYQGKPLYRYSAKDPIGEPQGARFQLIEAPAWHDPSSDVYTPKKGWRRAAFMPEKTAVIPTSVQLESLEAAGGFGLVDAATLLTVYAVPVSHKLSADWQPVRAAALAVPVGDFSITTRKEDGSRQWTYKGEALYTYAGDYAPGDANGGYTGDKSVQPALLYRNFDPPGVTVADYVGRGPLMVNGKGQPLYYVSRFHMPAYGGREIAGELFRSPYNEIKSQGTDACQGDCTASWKPLMADKGALSSGFWELMDRPDGKQWAFKGSPAYTFVSDKKPGDMEGNNRYVVVYGGTNDQIVYADAGSDPHSPALKLGTLTMLAAARSARSPVRKGATLRERALAVLATPRPPARPFRI